MIIQRKLLPFVTEKYPQIIYLFIDEGEHALHPHWQKKYLKLLIDFLKFFTGVKFQLLVTSHSPIMLSDIPKSNIIFLKKTDSKQSVLVESNNRPETFGANIHTLFRDSFFVQDGLVGQFAELKIDSLIKRINNTKESTIEEINSIVREIDIIGEPILRKTLKEKLVNNLSEEAALNYYQEQIDKINARRKRN